MFLRKQLQTAKPEKLILKKVTVTMPVHPFVGMELAFVRIDRDQNGNRFVYVEHPKEGFLRLPISWTNLCHQKIPPQKNGKFLCIGIKQLFNLLTACASARNESLDIFVLKQRLTEAKPSQGLANDVTGSDSFNRQANSCRRIDLGNVSSQNALSSEQGGEQ